MRNCGSVLVFVTLLLSFILPTTTYSAYAAEETILSHAVVLTLQKIESQNITLSMRPLPGFKVYKDNLSFELTAPTLFPTPLAYASQKSSFLWADPFSHTQKEIFEGENTFFLTPTSEPPSDAQLFIHIQACSQTAGICLRPGTLTLALKEGARATEQLPADTMRAQEFAPQPSLSPSATPHGSAPNDALSVTPKSAPALTSAPSAVESQQTILTWEHALATKLTTALQTNRIWIFPLLFLAGLLMNLTPCVYPMIPLTLGVMNRFATGRSAFLYPLFYTGGMVITYALLGVVASMSGHLFGSQLSHPLFSLVMGILLIVFGLFMLTGGTSLGALQQLAHKIPLPQTHPIAAVIIMGAVSGLIAAPCTGPVLSTILVLIAQDQDPLAGFSYMIFFSLGFGLPYVFLGLFSQSIARFPKVPRLVIFTKHLFSALILSLAVYFLRPYLLNIPGIAVIFEKPSFLLVLASSVMVLLGLIWLPRQNIVGKGDRIALFLNLWILSLWLTLWANQAFVNPDKNTNSSITPETEFAQMLQSSPIPWETSLEKAIAQAQQDKKPLLVDIWASWCVACIQMEQTTWKNQEIVTLLKERYISVKLDYSDAPKSLEPWLNAWHINGLPAVLIFVPSSSSEMSTPVQRFEGSMPDEELLSALTMHSK